MIPRLFFLFWIAVVLGVTVTEVELIEVYLQPQPPHSLSFESTILDLHNLYRAKHQSQPLQWNTTVADYASIYASKYDCSGVLVHSGGPYGENLAIGYNTSGAVDAWYLEGSTYAYGTESTYNHFTAMVWNSTTALGCAHKYCNPVWGTYIICSYYPEGNIIGYSTENVFPSITTK